MKSYGRGRVDANQKEIVSFLRRIGAEVFDTSSIGGGFPDLVVCFRGQNLLAEVKNPKTYHGKAGLSKNQKEFASRWLGGPVHVVKTSEDALKMCLAADLNKPLDYQGVPEDLLAAVIKNLRANFGRELKGML